MWPSSGAVQRGSRSGTLLEFADDGEAGTRVRRQPEPAPSPMTDLRASVCREAGGLRGDDDRQFPVLFSRWRDADLHVVTESRQEVHQPLH